MKGVLRDGDTIARIGGDEFVAVLVDLASERDCFAVLERLLTAASNPFEIDGHTLQLSASIGVTFYPEDGADADLLMRHADRAMYQAKQSGRNRYAIFDIAGDAAAVSQSRIVEDIGKRSRATSSFSTTSPRSTWQTAPSSARKP